METITPFIAYSLALAVSALIPGPGVAALIGQALGKRVKDTMPFILGHISGDVFFLTLAVLGLSVVAKAFSGVFIVIKILGALYLLYIAYGLWTSKGSFQATGNEQTKSKKSRMAGGYLYGLVVTLGNPKTIIFYMALIPNVLDLNQVGFLDWSILATITAIILMITLLVYAFAASIAAGVLSSAKAMLRLNRAVAAIIGSVGIVVLTEAIDALSDKILGKSAAATPQ
jgi:threonine/homoserine/homoserine lactone efflux protein